MDAALALDGFDDDSRDVLGHHPLEGFDVAEAEVAVGVGDERFEGAAYGVLAGGTHGRRCPAVEAVQRREHLAAAGVADRQLERSLVRLGATVDEQRAVEVAGGDGRDPLGELRLLRDVVQVGDVGHPRDLPLHGAGPVGMRIAEGVDSDPGHQVQVLPPLGVVEIAAAPVRERNGLAAVVVEQIPVRLRFDLLEIH